MADASKPYGDVAYADPGYQADGKARYPIDTADHVKAAWSYIHQADNASKYSAEHLAAIKSRIKAAGSRLDVTLESDMSRSFASGEHPRVPSGPGGGEFTNAGSGKTPTKTPAKTSKGSAHHAHHTATGSGTLAYDPKADHGTGYGSAHGDSRVHTLQQALNRLGITDGHGKPLKDDGKLGPRTTAAVKKLQQRLGMKADGQVTPEFLKSVSAMKAAPATKHATAKRGESLVDVSRFENQLAWPALITRSFPVDDAAVRSGRVTCEGCGGDATGRMVDAYAAVFGEAAEVHDDHGHYIEDIDRAAFNKRLADISRSAAGVRAVNVYYNHAMTVHGSPSELASVPIGHPSVIRADGRGLLTATHYSRDPFADRILSGIIDGNIAGQSFTGRIVRSDPDRIPRVHRGADLPRVRRLELGLAEYGPTPHPYYAGALTVAVRAQLPDQHPDGAAGTAPPHPLDADAGAEEPQDALRSAQETRRKIRRFLALKGMHEHGSHQARND